MHAPTMVMDAWLRLSPWTVLAGIPVLAFLYIYLNDKKLSGTPPEALLASPERATEETVHKAMERVDHLGPEHPILSHLPPATGRRYVIVGGSGFTGGWMLLHLIHRGEDPKRIRVLDLRSPTRPDLTSGPATLVDFVSCDITVAESVHAAFVKPWPNQEIADAPLTVFHTAANIRFYERHPALLSRSEKINVLGTQNVVDGAKEAGASVLIYTSSGSVAVKSSRFLLWPWEREPKNFVQHISDEKTVYPTRHEDFFSNYSASKAKAEAIIRKADHASTNGVTLRTGSIKPSNGVYGPGGDLLCGAFLVRRMNPTWIANIIENFCAVEVVSLAHMCYERRLIELLNGAPHPDIGGQSFIVTDPGSPVSYGDVYLSLTTLTGGETMFPKLSATMMLLLAHAIEAVYLLRELSMMSSWGVIRFLGKLVPRVTGDLINLQPSLWSLAMVHLIFDGSRARLPAEQGGLGLSGGLSTLDSLCLLVNAYRSNQSKIKGTTKGEPRAAVSGGVSLGLGFFSFGKKANSAHVNVYQPLPPREEQQ